MNGIMAKTNEFEIYLELEAGSVAANTPLDLTDYVDIADNEAFEIHAVSIVLDLTEGMPDTCESQFQLADSNIDTFVSHADRTSLYVARFSYQGNAAGEYGMWHQESFSDLTPLIVSKTLFCRNKTSSQGAAQTLSYTLRLKGKIVKPSAKDYMALVLTQTGNVA